MTTQPKELDRVKKDIGFIVLQFIRTRWFQGNPTFYMWELHDCVRQQIDTAPASPDRILRALRQDGYFDYEVIDRRASRYKITGVFNVGCQISTPEIRKVKIKVWRVPQGGLVGDWGTYFTEDEANSAYEGYGVVEEEIVEAIRA